MSVDLGVQGAEGIARVAEQVRRLGSDRTIVNEMAREIRRAVPPIRRAVRTHEVKVLPKRGGLGAWVAKGSVAAAVRRGADNAGVTIRQGRNSDRHRTDMKAINAGGTRHPLFGNRKKWYFQKLPADAFDDAFDAEVLRKFREAVVRAVDNATAKLL